MPDQILIAPLNLFLLRQLTQFDIPEFKTEANNQAQHFDTGALHLIYFHRVYSWLR